MRVFKACMCVISLVSSIALYFGGKPEDARFFFILGLLWLILLEVDKNED